MISPRRHRLSAPLLAPPFAAPAQGPAFRKLHFFVAAAPGGGPARAAILGRQVRAGVAGRAEFGEDIRAGRMRALATTGAERLDPAVPTLREAGVELAAANWRGVCAAPGLSPQQRGALESLVAAIRATPAWREQLALRLWSDAFLAGEALSRFLTDKERETTAVLRELGLA